MNRACFGKKLKFKYFLVANPDDGFLEGFLKQDTKIILTDIF